MSRNRGLCSERDYMTEFFCWSNYKFSKYDHPGKLLIVLVGIEC